MEGDAQAGTRAARCVVLSSGGLDSLLAVEAVRRNRPDVDLQPTVLSICSPFWGRPDGADVYLDVDERYFAMLRAPTYGYGKNMNPCTDCKIYMMTRARELMEHIGGEFVASGEVVGQRPNSQVRHKMDVIARDSGLGDRLVRPLCALHLAPTRPERDGLLDRARLYRFSGRGRKPQMALAREFDIEEFPSPGGGCLLTDRAFADRLRQLFRVRADVAWRHVELLKKGRFFFEGDTLIAMGRNHEENERLVAVLREHFRFRTEEYTVLNDHRTTDRQPFAVALGPATDAVRARFAELLARYTKPRAPPPE
eukprot:gnl/Chilomastix_cuspidata/1536.p1 GENE.gnl/Chilomastix_cuspidata/1536~~gnl/Chilomastix_cuspidata/1536.p1  ORF type:complete len:318 (+),score=162.02 gnl/Chilomastix_cuspidata/1536:26-955(+)